MPQVLKTDLLAFYYMYLPEVKGRTLEEVDELFGQRLSLRNFPTYVCENSTVARETAAKDMEKNLTVTVVKTVNSTVDKLV